MVEELPPPSPLPMQPIGTDAHGVIRFRENAVVELLRKLASAKGVDLNVLVINGHDLPQEDWEQFYQLIGYSLSGYGELNKVSNTSYETAEKMSQGGDQDWRDAKIRALEEQLDEVKVLMREGVAQLYGKHPDDILEIAEEDEEHV